MNFSTINVVYICIRFILKHSQILCIVQFNIIRLCITLKKFVRICKVVQTVQRCGSLHFIQMSGQLKYFKLYYILWFVRLTILEAEKCHHTCPSLQSVQRHPSLSVHRSDWSVIFITTFCT